MRKGSKQKESSKIKMSESHKGKPLSEKHRLALIGSHYGYRHSDEVKRKIGLSNRIPINTETLTKLYIDNKLAIKQIALEMGISTSTIHRNLCLLGIVRNPSEARRLSRPPKCTFYLERKLPEHPRANKRGYVKEHILAWERANSKSLPIGWVIHHLNGIKNDNRTENLIAMPNGNHCSGLVNEALRKRILELEAKLHAAWYLNYGNATNQDI